MSKCKHITPEQFCGVMGCYVHPTCHLSCHDAPQYPTTMRSTITGLVVRFMADTVGEVIANGNERHPIGYTSTVWAKSSNPKRWEKYRC